MTFRQCFFKIFFDTPDVARIVPPKVLQNFKLPLLAQGTEPKRFRCNIRYRTRLKGPPFQFFSALRDFFLENNFPKGSPLQFFEFCDKMDVENPQRVLPFSFFGIVRLFFSKIFFIKGSPTHQSFDILKSFCYF